ncbi:hypothetical protein QUF90_17090 [Desulfococcaceae bacterium HSG9]|nr:hypothetical protein [Desulfococcaceae bacterium HSG9]
MSEKVMEEARRNAKYLINREKTQEQKDGNFRKDKFIEKESLIDKKIEAYRSFVMLDSMIKQELGNDFFKKVTKLSDYKKNNGEFYSAALSLYLSRRQARQLTFYTDDAPAQKALSVFFRDQQIGKIEDSVDLLVLLFWIDPVFNENKMINYLTELRSQLRVEIRLLEKSVKHYKNRYPRRKHSQLFKLLSEMERRLSDYDLKRIEELMREIFKLRKKYRELCENLAAFDDAFSKSYLLDKIEYTIKNIKKGLIFKVDRNKSCIGTMKA